MMMIDDDDAATMMMIMMMMMMMVVIMMMMMMMMMMRVMRVMRVMKIAQMMLMEENETYCINTGYFHTSHSLAGSCAIYHACKCHSNIINKSIQDFKTAKCGSALRLRSIHYQHIVGNSIVNDRTIHAHVHATRTYTGAHIFWCFNCLCRTYTYSKIFLLKGYVDIKAMFIAGSDIY